MKNVPASEPVERAMFTIFGGDFFRLEAACRLLLLQNRAVSFAKELFKKNPQPYTRDGMPSDIMREGCCLALAELYHNDAPRMLNTCRKLATGDLRLYKSTLDPSTLGVLNADSAAQVVPVFAEAFQYLVGLLEKRVQSLEVDRTLASYGVAKDADGRFTLNDTPSLDLYAHPKAFLGAWGTAFHRWYQARIYLQHRSHEKGRTVGDLLDLCLRDISSGIASVSTRCRSQRGLTIAEEADVTLRIAAPWVSCAMPLIQPSHKLAASLMATSVPSELLPEVVVPWSCFLVEVPEGLLTGLGCNVVYVGLRIVEGSYSFLIFTRQNSFVEINSIESLSELAHLKIPAAASLKNSEKEEFARVVKLLGRLLLGCMIELDDESQKTKIRQGPPKSASSHEPRRGKPPAAWTFQIKREVKVDARAFVRDYIEKGGKGLSVQVFVRGFRRRQPYGPRNSLRRWQHIEPYWKGSVDSPISVRPHKL